MIDHFTTTFAKVAKVVCSIVYHTPSPTTKDDLLQEQLGFDPLISAILPTPRGENFALVTPNKAHSTEPQEGTPASGTVIQQLVLLYENTHPLTLARLGITNLGTTGRYYTH